MLRVGTGYSINPSGNQKTEACATLIETVTVTMPIVRSIETMNLQPPGEAALYLNGKTNKMTKRELAEQNKILCDDLGLLVFAAGLADVRLPIEKAAAYAIRDGIHTEDEVAVILERLAARLIPPLEMMRAAAKLLEAEEDAKQSSIERAARPRIILPD